MRYTERGYSYREKKGVWLAVWVAVSNKTVKKDLNKKKCDMGRFTHTKQTKLTIQIKEKIGEKHCKLVFTVFLPSIHYSKVQKK